MYVASAKGASRANRKSLIVEEHLFLFLFPCDSIIYAACVRWRWKTTMMLSSRALSHRFSV